MLTAKVFENGRSQAVRLPKEYRFEADEVAACKIGDVVLLMPKTIEWENFVRAVKLFRGILWWMDALMVQAGKEKNYEIYVRYKYLYLCHKTKSEAGA